MKRKPGSKRNTEKRSEQKKLERRKRVRKAANVYRATSIGRRKRQGKKWQKPSTRSVKFDQQQGTFTQEIKIEGAKS